MQPAQHLDVVLPAEMADAVAAKVATGEYASESEVLLAGLRLLLARDDAIEAWLREQVAPTSDAIKADPSRCVSVDAVKARLAKEHLAAKKN